MEPKVFTPTMGKETCIYPVSFCLTYRKGTFAGFPDFSVASPKFIFRLTEA